VRGRCVSVCMRKDVEDLGLFMYVRRCIGDDGRALDAGYKHAKHGTD